MRREATEFEFHDVPEERRFKSKHQLDAEYEIWLAEKLKSLEVPEEPECDADQQESK